MFEFVVVCEARADAEIATELANRIFRELGEDWLEPYLPTKFKWSGIQAMSDFSVWASIRKIEDAAKVAGYRRVRYLRREETGRQQADYAIARKALLLVGHFQKIRPIRAVILIRDLDNQPARRLGLEEAQREFANDELEIIIATPNTKREVWVLHGFEPENRDETVRLAVANNEAKLHVRVEGDRLRSGETSGDNRWRNPKYLVSYLTDEDYEREKVCWIDTPIAILKKRGESTGLTDYLNEVTECLLPVLRNE